MKKILVKVISVLSVVAVVFTGLSVTAFADDEVSYNDEYVRNEISAEFDQRYIAANVVDENDLEETGQKDQAAAADEEITDGTNDVIADNLSDEITETAEEETFEADIEKYDETEVELTEDVQEDPGQTTEDDQENPDQTTEDDQENPDQKQEETPKVSPSFTGVKDGVYYVQGEVYSRDACSIVYKGYVYKVSADGTAKVYIKNKSASGTYRLVIGDKCYTVEKNTGKTSAYTGMYKGKYYKKSKLYSGKGFYMFLKNHLYKIKSTGDALVYVKNKSGTGYYKKAIGKKCYYVSYTSGKLKKFTGFYKGKYYVKSNRYSGKAFYKINGKYLYKISKSGAAGKYVKNKSKSGYYKKAVDNKCYLVAYSTGKIKSFTGAYKKKYYVDSKPYKGWRMIGKKNVYYYKNGSRLRNTKVNGITLDANGAASGNIHKLVPIQAKCIVAMVTNDSMSKSEKLRAAFDYLQENFYSTNHPRMPHYTGMDWAYVYAYDMFGPRNGGNCMSWAAAFAFLAAACGYDSVYACNTGHSWTEVDGLVYDPEWYHDTNDKIYAYSYNAHTYCPYSGVFSAVKSNPYMRVKVKV